MTELKLYNMDCVEGAKKYVTDNSVDLIITDPPYGINGDKLDKHYNRDESLVVDGYVEIPESEYADFSMKWIKEAERILRPGGSIYIVSGYTNLHHILNALHQTKLVEVNHLIWKYNFGVYTKNKYISSHYHILFWQKPKGNATFNTFCRYGDSEKEGKSSLNYLDREDVFIINREYKPGVVKNKNELPSELLIKMIQYSSNPGDVVCDMFLGGFSTATVSKGLNRQAIGFEISPTAYQMGLSRFENTEPGSMIELLREPGSNVLTNCGKSWTEEDRTELKRLYVECSNMSKKDVIEYIGKAMGRGRWSIDKELDRMGLVVKGTRGRPKKPSDEENNEPSSSESPSGIETATDIPEKRGRGRPKKNSYTVNEKQRKLD